MTWVPAHWREKTMNFFFERRGKHWSESLHELPCNRIDRTNLFVIYMTNILLNIEKCTQYIIEYWQCNGRAMGAITKIDRSQSFRGCGNGKMLSHVGRHGRESKLYGYIWWSLSKKHVRVFLFHQNMGVPYLKRVRVNTHVQGIEWRARADSTHVESRVSCFDRDKHSREHLCMYTYIIPGEILKRKN